MLTSNAYITIKSKTQEFILIIHTPTHLKSQPDLAFKVFYYIIAYKYFQLYGPNKKICLDMNCIILLINCLFFKKIILKIKI